MCVQLLSIARRLVGAACPHIGCCMEAFLEHPHVENDFEGLARSVCRGSRLRAGSSGNVVSLSSSHVVVRAFFFSSFFRASLPVSDGSKRPHSARAAVTAEAFFQQHPK